ncbi:DUF3060 domain-containing protein [Mycolicibacterium fluoranthenivorans]|uniref:DUF3060 domain-containing protein n=1 Tax=Mycolicibacterium fluoranthenivorans TaxID=258505 RepID=A0A7X5U5E2_9MYCO|nr:DUF3060 domain-containing protein [Mycolicibacterium fluoranthenivorans]MCV7354673.1 DUF3060 domain-containing protein [Mycolicibacterium fluoranthenivorans]NIH98737.1 hypothetical protein [Mycolicibacterium fluoranthenivorans]
MNPQDDPEARIRALEQPLSDMARASELGTDQQYSADGYTPPPPPTAQWSYHSGYPSGFPTAPPRSGFRLWMLILPVMISILALVGGIVTWVILQNATMIRTSPGISGGGGLITSAAPSRRSTVNQPPTAVPTAAPSQTLPQPGSTVSVSGIGAVKTIACNENVVVVSGANNRVTITGHCTSLTVSGFENNVTVDTADAITASGFNNHVAFHSGSPAVNQSGEGNLVEQS